MLGILSGPGALFFAKFFRHMSYVSLSKYVVVGFVSFLFYLILVLLSRAMGIFLLHMCIMVCVMVGGSMLVQ